MPLPLVHLKDLSDAEQVRLFSRIGRIQYYLSPVILKVGIFSYLTTYVNPCNVKIRWSVSSNIAEPFKVDFTFNYCDILPWNSDQSFNEEYYYVCQKLIHDSIDKLPEKIKPLFLPENS